MLPNRPNEKQSILTEWVNQYGDQLYSWAVYQVSDTSLAQDIVQETLISAHNHFHNLRDLSRSKSWLFSILKNKIADHHRAAARELLVRLDMAGVWEHPFNGKGHWQDGYKPVQWQADATVADDPDFADVLKKCLDELPSGWSHCLRLKYFHQKKTAEICQELSITSSNLWQIMHRAKLQMRSCLEKNWFTKINK